MKLQEDDVVMLYNLQMEEANSDLSKLQGEIGIVITTQELCNNWPIRVEFNDKKLDWFDEDELYYIGKL